MPASSTLIRRDKVFISENMNKNALIKALRKHGLTATKVIKPIVDALEATKLVVHGKEENAWTEEEIDHATRLRAAQLAIDLLGLKNAQLDEQDDKKTSKLLSDALNNSDEVKLQQIVFNKHSESAPNPSIKKKV